MMVRALIRPALPVLLALGLSTGAADGGVMSVAEPPEGNTSSLFGDTIVRISSAAFQADASFGTNSTAGGPGSPSFGFDHDLPEGWKLAGSSAITMGHSVINVQRFTFDREVPAGNLTDLPSDLDNDTETSANPEPAGVILLCIGAAGLAGYTWRARKANRPTV